MFTLVDIISCSITRPARKCVQDPRPTGWITGWCWALQSIGPARWRCGLSSRDEGVYTCWVLCTPTWGWYGSWAGGFHHITGAGTLLLYTLSEGLGPRPFSCTHCPLPIAHQGLFIYSSAKIEISLLLHRHTWLRHLKSQDPRGTRRQRKTKTSVFARTLRHRALFPMLVSHCPRQAKIIQTDWCQLQIEELNNLAWWSSLVCAVPNILWCIEATVHSVRFVVSVHVPTCTVFIRYVSTQIGYTAGDCTFYYLMNPLQKSTDCVAYY